MDYKQRNTIRVSGVDANGGQATVDFTSDAISFPLNRPWTLGVWATGLTFVTTAPTLTIEVSNDEDINSFKVLSTADNKTIPERFESDYSRFRFWRIIYNSQGATGGTVNFDLDKLLG